MRRVALVCATVAAFVSSSLEAQGVSVLTGGVLARYADSISGSAALVAVRIGGLSPRSAGTLEASFSRFASGGWISQISGQGSALLPVGRTASVGVVGAGFASVFQGGPWVGGGTVGPLVTVVASPFVFALSLSGGYAQPFDASALPLATADTRLRWTVHESVVFEGGLSATVTDSLRYLDGVGVLSLRRRPLLIAVTGGVRTGDLADDPWGQARIEIAVGSRVTFEAAGGRYPRDLLGFTDGVFANAGFRFHLSPRHTERTRSPLRVVRIGDRRVRLEFDVRTGEDTPSIVGEWNGWDPIPLERGSAGRWTIELPLQPGVYKYALALGDTWTVPAGAPSVPDDFGGRLGIIIVR